MHEHLPNAYDLSLLSRGRQQALVDSFEYSGLIRQHLMVPETQHSKACCLQKHLAPRIRLNLQSMVAAIKLNDQPSIETDKIDDVRSDGLLPAELESIQPAVAQLVPKPRFHLGHLAAQPASIILQGHLRSFSSAALLPLPLAGEGRGEG